MSDTRSERRPVVAAAPDPDAESGRGLLLVTALADEWGVTDRRHGPGKTVWAAVKVPQASAGGVRLSPCRRRRVRVTAWSSLVGSVSRAPRGCTADP
ncbi:ATP-binding protein [Streptomyces griseoluteus]|uniref:ATP-binding protein n=1 Tax=Streptomyces griseoluteus TaxID=29306 RepID=UPI003692D50E